MRVSLPGCLSTSLGFFGASGNAISVLTRTRRRWLWGWRIVSYVTARLRYRRNIWLRRGRGCRRTRRRICTHDLAPFLSWMTEFAVRTMIEDRRETQSGTVTCLHTSGMAFSKRERRLVSPRSEAIRVPHRQGPAGEPAQRGSGTSRVPQVLFGDQCPAPRHTARNQ